MGLDIPTYGVAALIGIALAVFYVGQTTKGRKGIDQSQMLSIAAVAFIGAFIGAHIMYGITHLDKIGWCITHTGEVFKSFEAFMFYVSDIFGGMVFYGGLIGGTVVGMIYCKKQNLDILFYADIYAPAIPLFHAFGRIGCFLGGCCYGIESRWGFFYPNEDVIRLPIQLIESLGDILIFAVLVILSHKGLRKGIIFWLYVLMYGILRIATEFFRGDSIRGVFFGISTSQWISFVLIIVSSIMIFRIARNPTRTVS